MSEATNAAAPEMKPSITTGRLAAAASRITPTSPASNHVFGVELRERTDERSGGGRIADPHVAGERDVKAIGDLIAGEPASVLDGLASLRQGHRWATRDACGSAAHLQRTEVGMR